MPAGPLVVITGPPGSGKTTVAQLVAARFEPRACLLEADWWWTTIVKGHVPPWQPEAHEQNRAVVRSFSAAAAVMAQSAYPTVLEGIVGPWMLDLLTVEAARRGVEVDYVVVRPRLEIALERAVSRAGDERVPGHPALTDEDVIRKMWEEFARLGDYERFVVDTSDLDVSQTANDVWARVSRGSARLT